MESRRPGPMTMLPPTAGMVSLDTRDVTRAEHDRAHAMVLMALAEAGHPDVDAYWDERSFCWRYVGVPDDALEQAAGLVAMAMGWPTTP